MEKLPDELLDKIFEYCVDNFRALVRLETICNAWKLVAGSSPSWFTLKLAYSRPGYYSVALKPCIRNCFRSWKSRPSDRELVCDLNESVFKPSSLALHVMDRSFTVNFVNITDRNKSTARMLRNQFISVFNYYTNLWDYYDELMQFFTEAGDFANDRKLFIFGFSLSISIILLSPGFKDNFLEYYSSLFISSLQLVLFFLYLVLALYQFVASYFLHTEYLNRFNDLSTFLFLLVDNIFFLIATVINIVYWVNAISLLWETEKDTWSADILVYQIILVVVAFPRE
jgi:hypothetical protein